MHKRVVPVIGRHLALCVSQADSCLSSFHPGTLTSLAARELCRVNLSLPLECCWGVLRWEKVTAASLDFVGSS